MSKNQALVIAVISSCLTLVGITGLLLGMGLLAWRRRARAGRSS